MKKFIGYFIIGASTKKDAHNERGLLLWSTKNQMQLSDFLIEYF